MNFDFNFLVILGLGMLLGGIIANKRFRIAFFRWLRKFLVQLSSGARSYSAQYQRERTRGKVEGKRQGQPHPDEVRHRYVQDHHLVKCGRCDGTGRLKRKAPAILDKRFFGDQTERCPDCEGTGKVYD